MNNVNLIGRLTRNLELRHTQNDKSVATFTLAVNRTYKNAQGEYEADFISCVVWGKSAENLEKWAKKGNLIGLTGSLQTRNYENNQGQKVYVTEVLVRNFQLLESRKASAHPNDPFAGGAPANISDEDLPF